MWLRFMYLYALWLSDSDVPSKRAKILKTEEEEDEENEEDDDEESDDEDKEEEEEGE